MFYTIKQKKILMIVLKSGSNEDNDNRNRIIITFRMGTEVQQVLRNTSKY